MHKIVGKQRNALKKANVLNFYFGLKHYKKDFLTKIIIFNHKITSK